MVRGRGPLPPLRDRAAAVRRAARDEPARLAARERSRPASSRRRAFLRSALPGGSTASATRRSSAPEPTRTRGCSTCSARPRCRRTVACARWSARTSAYVPFDLIDGGDGAASAREANRQRWLALLGFRALGITGFPYLGQLVAADRSGAAAASAVHGRPARCRPTSRPPPGRRSRLPARGCAAAHHGRPPGRGPAHAHVAAHPARAPLGDARARARRDGTPSARSPADSSKPICGSTSAAVSRGADLDDRDAADRRQPSAAGVPRRLRAAARTATTLAMVDHLDGSSSPAPRRRSSTTTTRRPCSRRGGRRR